MHVRGLNTYNDYLRLLTTDPGEYAFLLEDLTINVTQFFRDPEVFKILAEEILPIMIYKKVKRNRKVIRIWSAGCSSGEETYSLGIIMHDLLDEEFDNFNVTIYGTDIDNSCLDTAKKGRYFVQQLENVKPAYLKRYFNFDGEMYQISDNLIDFVKFKYDNLFENNKKIQFDLISCRNVFIYFKKEMQKGLFDVFYNSLNPDGYLVLGKTETLIGFDENKFSIVNAKHRIYQKIDID
jgi:chemotaxis protein methyltransferase CheR